MNAKKIPAVLLYAMFMLSVGISNHVLLIPVLLQIGKRDAWIAAIGAVIPVVLWVFILHAVVKNVGSGKVTDVIRRRYGAATGRFVMVLVAVYCLINSLVSLDDFVTWTNVAYLPQTPRFVVTISFVSLCFFAANAGIRAIAITSGLLLPVVVMLGILVMSANFQYKDYSLLFPLLTHGYAPLVKGAIFTSGALFELILIVFLQQHVSSRIKRSSLIILAVILIGLTVGPLAGAIAIFGPFEAAVLRYPAFEQWRMVQMGKYIAHVDFFSIYQWVSGAFIRVSLLSFLAVDVLGIQKGRLRTMLLAGMCVIYEALLVYPWNDTAFFIYLNQWHFSGSCVFNLFLSLMLLGLMAFTKKRNKKKVSPS